MGQEIVDLIVGLAGVLAGILVAVIIQWFDRRQKAATARKVTAEAGLTHEQQGLVRAQATQTITDSAVDVAQQAMTMVDRLEKTMVEKDVKIASLEARVATLECELREEKARAKAREEEYRAAILNLAGQVRKLGGIPSLKTMRTLEIAEEEDE